MKTMIDKEIKNNWFVNHIAKYEKLNERVSTLTWSNPNSSMYCIRYIFDGSTIYVSGDIGEAVFSLTERADIKSISKYGLHYFHSKLSAYSNDKYSFNTEQAITRLKEEIKEADDDYEEDVEKIKSVETYINGLRFLLNEVEGCSNKSNWDYEVYQIYDDLTDYDTDVAEWIFNIGDCIPNAVKGYLMGIQMACEQLKEVLE